LRGGICAALGHQVVQHHKDLVGVSEEENQRLLRQHADAARRVEAVDRRVEEVLPLGQLAQRLRQGEAALRRAAGAGRRRRRRRRRRPLGRLQPQAEVAEVAADEGVPPAAAVVALELVELRLERLAVHRRREQRRGERRRVELHPVEDGEHLEHRVGLLAHRPQPLRPARRHRRRLAHRRAEQEEHVLLL
jgi:hypothetical protein